jgi:hypothetical protein
MNPYLILALLAYAVMFVHVAVSATAEITRGKPPELPAVIVVPIACAFVLAAATFAPVVLAINTGIALKRLTGEKR